MKMNYLRNRSIRFGKRPEVRRYALFAVLLLFSALALWRSEWIRAPLFSLATPIWRIGNALGARITGIAAYLQFQETLLAENEELKQEAMRGEALLAEHRFLREENQELKRRLSRSGSERRILVAVLVSPPRAPYDALVLDGGTEAGIAVGDDVLYGETVLGRVTAVTQTTATAALFSTAGVTTPAVVWRGDEAIPADAVGEGGGIFRITVPKETGIAVGDRVVMPGINPKQFGAVAVVEASETDSFATAFVRSPVNILTLRFLEIRAVRHSP